MSRLRRSVLEEMGKRLGLFLFCTSVQDEIYKWQIKPLIMRWQRQFHNAISLNFLVVSWLVYWVTCPRAPFFLFFLYIETVYQISRFVFGAATLDGQDFLLCDFVMCIFGSFDVVV